jgi:GNAT superfamily N-acetyltransferase
MVEIQKIDTSDRRQVNEFVHFHYRLYAGTPQWVPPFYNDIKLMLNREKHPFYEHSDADFFVARRGGEVVGRIAAMELKPFNEVHGVRDSSFYLFDSVDDIDVAKALVTAAVEWAQKRGLTRVAGPKGFSPFDGYGIQIEGFEHHQMMTMMNYNFPYYQRLMEALGFEKKVDFVSCYLHRDNFQLPEKAREIARRVQERGTFTVKNFASKAEMLRWGDRIGEAYNKTFVNNWEYYPLTPREIKFTVDSVLTVAVPQFIKIILHHDDVVGFLFAFPDISQAIQRARGRLTPWSIADMLISLKRTNWVSGNGIGVLPEYQGRGGTALMYSELEKTVRTPQFEHLEMTQVAESAVQMRRDLINLGGKAYKNHRVFQRSI